MKRVSCGPTAGRARGSHSRESGQDQQTNAGRGPRGSLGFTAATAGSETTLHLPVTPICFLSPKSAPRTSSFHRVIDAFVTGPRPRDGPGRPPAARDTPRGSCPEAVATRAPLQGDEPQGPLAHPARNTLTELPHVGASRSDLQGLPSTHRGYGGGDGEQAGSGLLPLSNAPQIEEGKWGCHAWPW